MFLESSEQIQSMLSDIWWFEIVQVSLLSCILTTITMALIYKAKYDS